MRMASTTPWIAERSERSLVRMLRTGVMAQATSMIAASWRRRIRARAVATGSGDRARLAERVERRAIVPEQAAEHLVGVLAGRGHRADARRRLRELDRRARHVHLAGHRVVLLHAHLALPQLRVVRDLGDRAHRGDRE